MPFVTSLSAPFSRKSAARSVATCGFIAVCIRFSFFVSTTPPPAFDLPPDLPFALSRPFIVQRHEAPLYQTV